MASPTVVSSSAASTQIRRGFDTLANLLALTLGPVQGTVVSEVVGRSDPEVLRDAATIARRFTEFAERSQDVGAMLLRHLVWRQHEQVGDGAATAAVLAQAILAEASRYVVAGANPIQVRSGINRAAEVVGANLKALSRPAVGEEELAAVGHSITGDAQLGLILGELYDLLGPHAHITVEKHVASYLDRVYLGGGRWNARLASPYLVTAPTLKRAILPDCQIALYDGQLREIMEVVPLLELAVQQEPAHLLLVGQQIDDAPLGALVATHQRGQLKVTAVTLRGTVEKRTADFADLALLTGAQLLSPALGRPLQTIRENDLGHARRVEVAPDELLVTGGSGQTNGRLREQIAFLSQQVAAETDGAKREQMAMRLGRLSGNAAVLQVGAATRIERDLLVQQAEQGIRALRATVEEGIVPGGGTAYIACQAGLDGMVATGDEKLGVMAVNRALKAPFQRILLNAGVDAPALVGDELVRCGSGYVYDVRRHEILTAAAAGLFDSTRVLRLAIEIAASGAGMALTTDTIIHRRQPETSQKP